MKKKSLLETHFELCKEWDYKANGNLRPEHVTHGSGKKVIWICSKGHKYNDVIRERVIGRKCPYCYNLLTTHPELCKQWDYEKNGDLKPEHVTYGSGKNVCWVCSKGHSYKSIIREKTSSKGYYRGNCPFCHNLLTTHPELCKQWDYEKNGDLKPENVTHGSVKKIWWICNKGHSYKTEINSKTYRDSKCPYCSNKKVNMENCFLVIHPELCKQWDYEKNGDLKPENFVSGSVKKVWWKCSKGHRYKAQIRSRIITGCPYCCNQKISVENSLLTTHPELCLEWDYEANGNLRPEHITHGSEKIIWWKCIKGHNFRKKIRDRIKNLKCPYCYNLLTTHPELCKQWDYEKNGDLKPENVTHGSVKKIWWKCLKGHTYRSMILSRTKGTGCPYCLYKTQEKCREIFENIFKNKFILCNPKWLQGLQLDGYNENLKLAFEYDGEFHYNNIIIKGKTIYPYAQQKRDKIKDILCKENGITLIRIPYTENNRLEEYIKEKLSRISLFL